MSSFLSREAGQARRAKLNNALAEFARYYLGPTGLPDRMNALGMMNPVNDMEQAGQNALVMFDPAASGRDRFNAGVGMATDMATVLAPAVGARIAGGDAVNALTDGLLGFGAATREGVDDAARRFVADEDGGASINLFRMADQDGALRAAQERTRASVPKAWLDPKYDPGRGFHPASNTKLGNTNVTPVFDDRGSLSAVTPLTFEDMQGTVITPAFGDRTRAGGNLLGFDDVRFPAVEMHGGQGFMRESGTGVWASEAGPMRSKAQTVREILEQGDDPRLIYTAMGAQSGDFSRMMADAVAGQLQGGKIPKAARSAFDDRMKSLLGDAWPGIDNIQAVHDLPGSTRWAVWQEMDRAKWRDMGFPDIGRTRLALTDPQLLDADAFDTGLAVSRPGGLWDTPDVLHPTYSTQIGGEYLGDAPVVPGPLVWRDFFEGRRSAGASAASDQRAFMMNSPTIRQRVDQQMVDEVGAYLEAQERAGALSRPSPVEPTSARHVNTPRQSGGRSDPLSSQGLPSVDVNTPEGRAQSVLDMLTGGRGADVTDDMLDLGDPVQNARLNEYLFRNYDLPMDEASRMARAQEMGFDTGAYHGTAGDDFSAFNRGGSSLPVDGATWHSTSPDGGPNAIAASRMKSAGQSDGRVLPLRLAPRNNLTVDAAGRHAVDVRGIRGAAGEGFDSVTIENVREFGSPDGTTSIATFDPRNIRSRFARFDPRLAHLRNLSAGVAGAAAVTNTEEIEAYLAERGL